MAKRYQRFQRISFTEDFDQTLEQFMELIKKDKDIKATVKEADLEKGLFSPAVRFLIRKYVDALWPEFVEWQKAQLNKRGEAIAAA